MTTITELSALQSGAVRIVELPSQSGYEPPSERQFKQLLSIVFAAHPEHDRIAKKNDDFEHECRLAFNAVAYMYRLREPSTRRNYVDIVADANTILKQRWIAKPVDGPAFWVGVYAHGDIAYRLADRRIGQPLEVGLDPFAGAPCTNAWRAVLQGAPLRSPLPPRDIFRQSAAPSPIRIFQEDRFGQF
jgi:hypothetical protein